MTNSDVAVKSKNNGRVSFAAVVDKLVMIESWIAIALAVMIVVLVFSGAVARYVFVHPIALASDIACYGFTVMIAFGLALALKKRNTPTLKL